MIDRRQFLRSALAAGGAAAVAPITALASRHQASADSCFGVHEFVEGNPDAVFIMKTNVSAKTDSAAIKAAALAFAQSVFVTKTEGTPISAIIPIKPNLTGNKPVTYNTSLSDAYDAGNVTDADIAEFRMGTVTDVNFVEGVIEGLKTLNISGNQMYVREVNGFSELASKGYTDMVTRTGINELKDLSANVKTTLDPADVQWATLDNGLWFNRIPHLWPVGAENTWMLNIAKFKAHYMGITGCCKNIQGSIAKPYVSHCNASNSDLTVISGDRNTNYSTEITANYNKHKNDDHVPRWSLGYSDTYPTVSSKAYSYLTGPGMEVWASRCTDNNISLQDTFGLHIVEGIYGRDGDFDCGPNTITLGSQSATITNAAKDYMSNIIIFGKNQVYVDIVGTYLGGHEPGNFGLFWVAKDRGLCATINPANIPVYEWDATTSTGTQKSLSDFTRTNLKTPYMWSQALDGPATNKYINYHMCNQAVTYPSDAVLTDMDAAPKSFVLHQNIPNPFNPSTTIEFSIPRAGNARLEVYNAQGQLMDVLVDGYYAAGAHMAVWNTNRVASGVYFYRFRYGGFSETKRMTLLK